MATTEAFAPAKVNLTLHVTGQRSDGYHLLDSYVMFADVGDTVRLTRAEDMALSVTGPFAAGDPILAGSNFCPPQPQPHNGAARCGRPLLDKADVQCLRFFVCT